MTLPKPTSNIESKGTETTKAICCCLLFYSIQCDVCLFMRGFVDAFQLAAFATVFFQLNSLNIFLLTNKENSHKMQIHENVRILTKKIIETNRALSRLKHSSLGLHLSDRSSGQPWAQQLTQKSNICETDLRNQTLSTCTSQANAKQNGNK